MTADFLTEDSYLGNIWEPLTLNRYNYCVGNPVNYADPSGNKIFKDMWDGLRKWLFGDPDALKAVPLKPEVFPTPTPEPEPWLLPTLEEEYSYLQEYGGGILPAGGIGYINQALGRQFSEMCDQYLEQQIANAEEDNAIEYVGGEDIMSKPDTPLYKYTEVNVKKIVVLDSKFDAERDQFKAVYEDNIERYKELADKTGVPPELIAVIHYREKTKDYLEGSFGVYLHNGEQLGKTTKKEPKGIYFDDFDLAAYDAIKRHEKYIEKYHLTADTKDIVAMMCFAEVYNGLGYYNNKHISPYLYSGTNLYTSGKYVEELNNDGVYESVYKEDVVDAQVGVYILLKAILDLEVEQ